jgi:hypothetical protein
MSTPDFASMDRDALTAFRKNAYKRKEEPSVENNYFTTEFKKERCHQPTDWVSTPIATEWCEHHGPSGHTTDNCKAVTDPDHQKKKQKPKIDLPTRLRLRKKVRSFAPPSRLSIMFTNKSHRSRKNSSC